MRAEISFALIDFQNQLDGEKPDALMERGFHKPGDAENRLAYYLSQIPS
jgi:hypothetical protein